MTTFKRIDIKVKHLNIPTKPLAFLDYWKNKIAEIPEKYMDSAYLEIKAKDDEYGLNHMSISFFYKRPEYLNETTERKAKEAKRETLMKNRDLIQLAQLKAKYPEVKDV